MGVAGLKMIQNIQKLKLLPQVNLDFSSKIIQSPSKNLIGTVGLHIAE